jgi:hypothetical protein
MFSMNGQGKKVYQSCDRSCKRSEMSEYIVPVVGAYAVAVEEAAWERVKEKLDWMDTQDPDNLAAAQRDDVSTEES